MKAILALLLSAFSCAAQLTIQNALYPPLLFTGGAFTPPESANLVLWLKPETLSGANGVIVSNWIDSSGQVHDFTNTPTGGPFLSNSLINGRSGVRFIGASTSFLKSNTNFMSGMRTGEIFAVLRSTASPGVVNHTTLWDFAAPGHSGSAAHPFTDSALYENWGLRGSRIAIPLTNTAFPTNWHIYNVATSTNYMLMRYNGNILAGNDVVFCAFTNNMTFGFSSSGGTDWDGEMAEVMMYNTIVSSNSRATIYAYLSNKFAIAVTNVLQGYYPSNFAGLIGHWDATTITSNNNDKLTYWPDLGPFNNFWTNNLGQAGFRPTFHTAVYNGLPAVWFDPANTNYMILTNAVGLALTNIWTIIAIHQLTNDSRDLFFAGFAPFGQLRYRDLGNNAMQMFNGVSGVTSAAGPQPVGQLQMDVMIRQSATVGGFWMNATNQAFSSANGAGPWPVNLLSINDPTITYAGHVAEICIYTNVLTVDAITKLYYTYFRPKWGLP